MTQMVKVAGKSRLRLLMRWALCALLLTCAALLATSLTGLAEASVPFTEITSSGPLNNIWIGNELSCQVLQSGQTAYSFFPSSTAPGDCGTFMFTGGTLYAPDFAHHGSTATSSLGSYTAWTPVSQSAVTGTGTSSDPYTITTVADAGSTGLRLTEVDTYVVGQGSYRTDITIANSGTSSQDAILYRAGDCFFQGSDNGYGVVTGGNAPGCTINPNNSPAGPVEQWVPITLGNHYVEDVFDTVWSDIGSHLDFPNTCQCTSNVDNGGGISWNVTVPASGSITFSHVTTFSSTGQLALTTSKTADASSVAPGAQDGYTIQISNPNSSAVSLTDITDTLPSGFSYVAGSSSGATTSDPSVSGQNLTWSGSFSVPANGSLSLHFVVTAPSSPGGPFYDNAGGDASGGYTVVPTGDAAPVTVETPQGGTTGGGGGGPGFQFTLTSTSASTNTTNTTTTTITSTSTNTSTITTTPPTITSLPPPVLGTSANAALVSGEVFFKPPQGTPPKSRDQRLAAQDDPLARAALMKGQGFVPLTTARQIPIGSQIDSRAGKLQLVTATGTAGKTQSGVFGGAIFGLGQDTSSLTKGLTTLSLLEGDFPGAPSFAQCQGGAARDVSALAAGKPVSHRVLQALSAHVHGHFRSRGHYSSATVRGTVWTTTDRCDGTLTQVSRGTVAVRDFTRRKTVIVDAGHSYLAKASTPKHR